MGQAEPLVRDVLLEGSFLFALNCLAVLLTLKLTGMYAVRTPVQYVAALTLPFASALLVHYVSFVLPYTMAGTYREFWVDGDVVVLIWAFACGFVYKLVVKCEGRGLLLNGVLSAFAYVAFAALRSIS